MSEHSLIQPEGIAGDIHAHYADYIQPHCAQFEHARLDAFALCESRKPLGYMGMAAAMALVIGLSILFPEDSDGDPSAPGFLIFGAVACFFVWMWVQYPKSQYRKSIKQDIFPHVFSFFGTDYSYDADASSVTVEALKPSGIIPRYNSGGDSNEDLVRGSYQDVALEFFESQLVSGSGKNRRTVFRGMFITLSMNKNFHGHTIVKRDLGKLGNFFGDKFSKLDNVKLEDPVFEEQFEVYSSDQVEARYLLTPAFMERLLHLESVIGGVKKNSKKAKRRSGIQVAFYENKLLLMISTGKDRFEVGNINEPVTFIEDINTILSEMKDIFAIIEHLKLHEQTRL